MKAVDFFCGGGGLTRGLLDAGIQVVAGFDIDEECTQSYERNNHASSFHAKHVKDIDLHTLRSASRLRKFDETLFVGCAPCQPFSQHRKNSPRNQNATLLGEFGRIVESALPRAILIENVPGMARVVGFSTFRRFVRTLVNNKYSVAHGVLDAKDFGVPQTRRRLVLIAVAKSDSSLPGPTYGRGSRPPRTVRQAIEHFPAVDAGKQHDSIPNHVAASVSDLNLERLRNTPHDGGDRRSWPKKLRLTCHGAGYEGHTDVYGRMAWDSPAPTLTARCHSISNGRYGHPEQNRAITLREAAAIQSFPDQYEFFGSNKHIAQQIGNAVPVRFAERLGRHILEILDPGSLRRRPTKLIKN